jgi:hypothetical protein
LLSTKNIKFKGVGVPKLMPKWIGPFDISELIGPVDSQTKTVLGENVRAVRLDLPPLMQVHPVFHVSLIKGYADNGERRPAMPLEFDSDGSPQWVVQTLLKKRQSGRGRRVVEFLVRWKGFGPEHDSWEPESNIACKTLVEDFHRRVRGVLPIPVAQEAAVDEEDMPMVPETAVVVHKLNQRKTRARVALAIVLPGKLYLREEWSRFSRQRGG